MAHDPGSTAPQTGIYWCSVCKLPVQFKAGETLPVCKNLCGRGKSTPTQSRRFPPRRARSAGKLLHGQSSGFSRRPRLTGLR